MIQILRILRILPIFGFAERGSLLEQELQRELDLPLRARLGLERRGRSKRHSRSGSRSSGGWPG